MYKILKITGLKDTISFAINYPSNGDQSEFDIFRSKGLIPEKANIGKQITLSAGTESSDGTITLAHGDIATLANNGVSAGTPVTIVRYGMLSDYSKNHLSVIENE